MGPPMRTIPLGAGVGEQHLSDGRHHEPGPRRVPDRARGAVAAMSSTDRPGAPAGDADASSGDAASPAERILDAAIRAIDERGEAALRVQDIVREAGVQIPILYRHYGNREGLVQAAQLERLRRDLTNEMEAIHAAIETAPDAAEFRALIEMVLDRMTSTDRRLARWRRVNVLGSTYGRPELVEQVAAAQQVAIDWIAELLARPASLGWLREGLDVRTIAATLRITEHTCRGYVKALMAKLGARTQLQAVVSAWRAGLLRQAAGS